MFGMFQSVTTKSKGALLSFCSATAPSKFSFIRPHSVRSQSACAWR